MRRSLFLTLFLILPLLAAGPAQAQTELDRTVLPISEPQYPHSTVFDVRNATPPPQFVVKAPVEAPNVLIVLIDDMGSASRAAGDEDGDHDEAEKSHKEAALKKGLAN